MVGSIEDERTLLGNLDVGVSQHELSGSCVKREAVHSVAGRQDQHGSCAVDSVASSHLNALSCELLSRRNQSSIEAYKLVTGLEKVNSGIVLASAGLAVVDAEDGAYRKQLRMKGPHR